MAEFQNCILYARFSSKGQRHGTSIERQLNDGRSYARTNGWEVTDELVDEGRSAFHGHHRSVGVLGTFESEARQGAHAGTLLIVERLDRLERGGPEDTFAFITGLTAAGVSIATIDGDELYSAGAKLNITQMLFLLFKAQVAHEESAKKSDRSKANWRIKFERAAQLGKPLSKRCPPWLRVEDGRYRINRKRAAVVARIFRMAESGCNCTAITRSLNRENVKPFGTAVMWHRARIVQVLSNRQVVGEHTGPHGAIMLYPPIIGDETFKRVSTEALVRKLATGGRRTAKVNNLLSGLCRCGRCNGPMFYSGPGYMRCVRAYQGGRCSNAAATCYGPVEAAVLDSCLHLALDNNAFTNRAEVARLGIAIREMDDQLVSATEMLGKLAAGCGSIEDHATKSMALAAHKRTNSLRANLERLVLQRERAKGRTSDSEHFRRVSELRSRLCDDVTLRQSVARGLRDHIDEVRFDANKTATIIITGSTQSIRVRNGAVPIRQIPN